MLCHRKSRKVAACSVRLSAGSAALGRIAGRQGWPSVADGPACPPAGPLTSVGQQALQRGPHTIAGQQLGPGLMPQQHTQHCLGPHGSAASWCSTPRRSAARPLWTTGTATPAPMLPSLTRPPSGPLPAPDLLVTPAVGAPRVSSFLAGLGSSRMAAGGRGGWSSRKGQHRPQETPHPVQPEAAPTLDDGQARWGRSREMARLQRLAGSARGAGCRALCCLEGKEGQGTGPLGPGQN